MVTPALARVFEKEGHRPHPLCRGGRDAAARTGVIGRPAEVVDPGAAAAAGRRLRPRRSRPRTSLSVFERKVTLADHPVLRSHVIGDKAVVPFVLHLEWMAHAAMHGNPGLKFHGFDDLRIFQGIHVEEATPADIARPVRKGDQAATGCSSSRSRSAARGRAAR